MNMEVKIRFKHFKIDKKILKSGINLDSKYIEIQKGR
jgi:hypothetical protein